jgi:hypothetical protein
VAWLADLVTDYSRGEANLVGDHGGGGEPSPLASMVARIMSRRVATCRWVATRRLVVTSLD